MKPQTRSTPLTLQQLQDASRRIEVGLEMAYPTVAEQFGPDVARALIVAHLRRDFGATTDEMPDSMVEGRVENWLDEHDLRW